MDNWQFEDYFIIKKYNNVPKQNKTTEFPTMSTKAKEFTPGTTPDHPHQNQFKNVRFPNWESYPGSLHQCSQCGLHVETPRSSVNINMFNIVVASYYLFTLGTRTL